MRQSSVDESPSVGRPVSAQKRGDDREQWYLLYAGLLGASLLSGGLWLMRGLISRATAVELIAGIVLVLGVGAVFSAIAGFFLLSKRVDRASEDVSRALDGIAQGTLPKVIHAPRGLGREARLAGAAAAALTRLRTWIEKSRGGIIAIEQELRTMRAPLPRLQEAVNATYTHLNEVTREARFLSASATEHTALTQRACVLASVIGQTHRDTAAFADRVSAAVNDASSTLSDCAARTEELRGLVHRQEEEAARCLEADRQLSEYLVAVTKTARRFKLLALHGAMEAARAGARTETTGTDGAEFRVVALEVRRLAVDLAKATDDTVRTMDASRRALQALHTAAAQGERHVDAARAALSLGVAAMEQATAAVSARKADDSALAEAGTELTILTSAIRERVAGSAKGNGDVADRLAMLDRFLADANAATREFEQALALVEATTARARETVTAIADPAQAPAPNVRSSRRAPKKRLHKAPNVSSTARASA